MFLMKKPAAPAVDTDVMDSALRELIAMIPPERERTPLTVLLLELAAALLLELRAANVAPWPTDRAQLFLDVLDRLGVQR